MNWDDLRHVLAVGRSGTLSAAGRSLRVDPTTVGRRILAIEAELGSRLFERTGDGYVATHTGHLALAHAEDVERTTLALIRQVEGSDTRVEGPVRITALDALFDHLIIPRLPRLLARHPGLELTFSSNIELVDLSRREADIAIRSRKPSHPDSTGRKLGRLATGAFRAVGLDPGAVPPLIGMSREHDATYFAGLLPRLFPTGTIVARGNSEAHMRGLVRAGIGIGLMDCFVGDADPGLCRVLPEPVEVFETWAEAHVAMFRAPRMQAVIGFLSEVFAEEAALLAGDRPRARPEAVTLGG